MVNKCSVWVKRSVWPEVKVGRGLSVGSIIQQPLDFISCKCGRVYVEDTRFYACMQSCLRASFFL